MLDLQLKNTRSPGGTTRDSGAFVRRIPGCRGMSGSWFRRAIDSREGEIKRARKDRDYKSECYQERVSFCGERYRVFHILPQTYTENYATFPIQMYEITD